MNHANMQRTIDLLLTPNTHVGFNLAYYIDFGDDENQRTRSTTFLADVDQHRPFIEGNCGTAACIAGHIALSFRDEFPAVPGSLSVFEAARDFLGLTTDEGHYLFFGYFAPETVNEDITVEQVVAEMREMIG